MQIARWFFAVLLTAFAAWPILAQTTDTKPYPLPKNVGDVAQRGRNVQRTMALLAGSTPAHRNTVRVLFYGQSITEQDWWHDVAADLKRRFPDANLVIENRALGGFSSGLLVKTAETDLYSFYPDLMIFHVYGGHTDYEDIIRRTRERTTAEVLIQTDHVTKDTDLTEETDPAKLRPDGSIWNSFMNYLWLPTVAKKYGCALLNQRDLWKEYLRDNHLHASELLKDDVHQNAFGNYLMAELVKPYLVRRTGEAPDDPMNCDTVRTHAVGKSVKWGQDGKLSLPFDGNRVDIIAGNGASGTPITITIDGKKPSEIPELYGFTRALATPGGKWPVVLKIGKEKTPLLEDWTMQVTRLENAKTFSFTLSGSRTGPDGSGRSDQRFVSRSGRIVIEPQDWNVQYSLALPGIKEVPATFVVQWKVVPFFTDTYLPTSRDSKTAGATEATETVVTVAQGLLSGPHTLELTAPQKQSAPAIAAIRVYRPPVQLASPAPAR